MVGYSFQLFSAREFPPLNGVLKMLAGAGYAYVEGYGAVYEDMEATGSALEEAGLTMPSGHFGLEMLEEEEERVVEVAKYLGIMDLYCPYLEASARPNDTEGWIALAGRLEAIQHRYQARGLALGWHNHDFEFQALPDGNIPMKLLLDNAPGLSWEMDVAWIVRGGTDPIEWLQNYGHRLTAVHVKDIALAGQGDDEDGWSDVGDGILDWSTLMSALRKTPARHFVLEHDNPSDVARFARRSLDTVSGF